MSRDYLVRLWTFLTTAILPNISNCPQTKMCAWFQNCESKNFKSLSLMLRLFPIQTRDEEGVLRSASFGNICSTRTQPWEMHRYHVQNGSPAENAASTSASATSDEFAEQKSPT